MQKKCDARRGRTERTPTSRHRCPIQKRPFSRLPCAPDLGHLRVHEDRACKFGSLLCTFSIRHRWRLRPHSSSRRASFVYMTTRSHFGHTGTAQKGASVCTADETSLQARCLCVHGGSDVLAGLSPSVYTSIGHSAPKGTISVCTLIEDICGLVGVLCAIARVLLRTSLPPINLRRALSWTP